MFGLITSTIAIFAGGRRVIKTPSQAGDRVNGEQRRLHMDPFDAGDLRAFRKSARVGVSAQRGRRVAREGRVIFLGCGIGGDWPGASDEAANC